jgi:hypothetical protein
MVRLNADGGEQRRILSGKPDADVTGGGGGGNDEDMRNSRRDSAFENGAAIRIEAIIVEVGVRVDQFHEIAIVGFRAIPAF